MRGPSTFSTLKGMLGLPSNFAPKSGDQVVGQEPPARAHRSFHAKPPGKKVNPTTAIKARPLITGRQSAGRHQKTPKPRTGPVSKI
jgi:hypothetical protein